MSYRSDLKEGCGFSLAFLAVVLGIFFVIGLVGMAARDKEGEDKSGAWTAAQGFVESRLKSPSTADFPWYQEEKIHYLGNDSYRVSSYVDAENSFGATMRSNYTCTVKREGERWTLVNIDMR